MTIIAKRSVQLNGHIYSKGESAEWDGPVDSRIAELFMAKDGSALSVTANGAKSKDATATTAERLEKLVATLGRKGIEQKLDELNVSYPATAKVETLAKLLLQQQGEIDA